MGLALSGFDGNWVLHKIEETLQSGEYLKQTVLARMKFDSEA